MDSDRSDDGALLYGVADLGRVRCRSISRICCDRLVTLSLNERLLFVSALPELRLTWSSGLESSNTRKSCRTVHNYCKQAGHLTNQTCPSHQNSPEHLAFRARQATHAREAFLLAGRSLPVRPALMVIARDWNAGKIRLSDLSLVQSEGIKPELRNCVTAPILFDSFLTIDHVSNPGR